MMRLSVVIALFASSVSASTYSISYSGLDSSSTIKRDGSAAISVEGALSARHVADIICRLNGLPPLIEEAAIRMPSLDTSLGTFTPLIVEVKNAGTSAMLYLSSSLKWLYSGEASGCDHCVELHFPREEPDDSLAARGPSHFASTRHQR